MERVFWKARRTQKYLLQRFVNKNVRDTLFYLDKISNDEGMTEINKTIGLPRVLNWQFFKTFTDHPLFKLDLINIFDNVKNFVASPARVASLAAI